MTPKNFIIRRLNELRNIFPELSFKYKFNQHTSTHIIDVRPLDCFSSNQDYIKYEADFSYEFDNLFSPETILFISENSLTEIKNPDFVFNTNQFSLDFQIPQPAIYMTGLVETNFEFKIEYALAA
ncbi:MAG: hypothetical protein LLG13_10505 [Bacteroidales bacterium]|nr:hypothetical protein [Bacteroidales bacterium]